MDILKNIHMLTALISISGFITRGIWMINGSARLKQKWVKVAPHINDTILLVSAIMLAVRIQQYPFATGWLTAKLIGLLLYIALGMMALRFGKTRRVKITAWLAAIIVFAYIVGVAVTRNALLVV